MFFQPDAVSELEAETSGSLGVRAPTQHASKYTGKLSCRPSAALPHLPKPRYFENANPARFVCFAAKGFNSKYVVKELSAQRGYMQIC